MTDSTVYDRAVARFAQAKIVLPTFAQLTNPSTIPDRIAAAVAAVDPDQAHPLNLFRVHWYNDHTRAKRAAVPQYVVLSSSLTGVEAKIVVASATDSR